MEDLETMGVVWVEKNKVVWIEKNKELMNKLTEAKEQLM